MARAHRVHMKKFTPDIRSDVEPAHLIRQDFANRLYNLMHENGWTQAELGRRAGIESRDSISTYINARSLPSPLNLEKLAKALGVTPEELLPQRVEQAIAADHPSIEVRVSTTDPTKAWLQINRLVSVKTAVKVVQIVAEDEDEISK